MMQWRIYVARHPVKHKYIVGAEDQMLCALKTTVKSFCGVSAPVAAPSIQLLLLSLWQ